MDVNNNLNNKKAKIPLWIILVAIAVVAVLVIAVILVAVVFNRGEESNIDSVTNDGIDYTHEENVREDAPPLNREPTIIADEDEGEEIVASVPTLLTVEESRLIVQAWLDEHPVGDMSLFDIDYYEEVTDKENDYYRFFHTDEWVDWFSILVNKRTGALYFSYADQNSSIDSLVTVPIDDWWWDWTFDPGCDVGPHFYNAVMSNARWIEISIYWDDGRETVFTRNPDRDWIMESRDGGTSIVYPEFSVDGRTIEIRFPTTTRVYYLYDDFTGLFGSERFTWDNTVRDND
jgi:hypothetical protein